MLQSFSSKRGTGISIFGHYGDLNQLYNTIHHFASSLGEYGESHKAQEQLLMNFAYEVRKASHGQRLIDKFTFPGDKIEHTFYGFQLVWTDILIFISVLRHNAGYVQSDKLHQALLYNLEFAIEKALFDYDAVGANIIKEFIGQRINIANPFAFVIYQALHIEYVNQRPGKMRFRRIPELLSAFYSEHHSTHKELIKGLQQSAILQNCKVTDLEFTEFPEAVW